MAVDLNELVEPLKYEVSAPGADPFPDATDDDYLGNLVNAFWEIRLYGYLSTFEENAAARGGPLEFFEAIVTPIGVDATYDDVINGGVVLPAGTEYSPAQDLSRDWQQFIVLWAGWKIALNRMSSLNTVFRAKAGPVEYETQQAASVLKGILDSLKERITYLLKILPTAGPAGGDTVLDAVIERTYSQATNLTWWVR